MVYLFVCCAYRFRNHRLLFVSTIDPLETSVIMLSYGGLGHGHDGGLDVADAGCTVRCLWFYGWCVYIGRSARFVVCSDYRVQFIATVAVLAQLV